MPGDVKEIPCVPKLERKKRVAAYARVSSGKDAMLHSLSAQVSYYSNLIQTHRGWQYCGVFSDEALTGTKDSRDGFQRMLTECRVGNLDLIIVKSISRFARNTVTLLETVRELKALNIDVYFEEQNIHTISAEGELLLTILASYAQEESLSVSENCKWYWQQRMKEGYMVGLRSMFGYDIVHGTIKVNPTEADIVRHVFSDYIAGASTVAIARALETAGIPRVNGGKWTATRIRDMLKNEKYIGDALLQKKYVADHLTKKLVRNHGELNQYYAVGTHEAIITPEIFEQAQWRLTGNIAKGNVKKLTTARYPLSGIITCGNCGKHYGRKNTNGRISWQCQTFLSQGKKHCPAKQIPEPTLLAMCCDALGMNEFDSPIFNERIAGILVTAPNEVMFTFRDGHSETRTWKDRSRAESWTPEMKKAAQERGKQGGMEKCRK